MLRTRTVYLISSIQTDKIYIGSTCLKLTTRLSLHKTDKNTTAKEIIKFGDAKIEWLCVKQNCTKEDIEHKEKYFIKLLKDICVNKHFTKDSKSKSYKAPSQLDPNYKEPCRLDGRFKKWQTTKNVCSICDGKYTNANKQHHLITKKHLKKSLDLENSKDILNGN